MMFACCHPALPRDSQVALTLRTLCGFGEEEIAAAFLSSSVSIRKRLVRARQRIREAGIAFEIPSGAELAARLSAVEQTLYLLFNEGYKTSRGDELVRAELCDEAIRLAELLAKHPVGDRPRTHALLALMWFGRGRLAARADADGQLLLLGEQDRTLWDQAMLARGLSHLNCSASGTEISEFHLEAGIASCHCTAPTYAATNWARILLLYNSLVQINRSPVIALHRAVAVAHVHGAAAALEAIAQISERELLQNYYLFHAVVAQQHFALGDFQNAAREFRRASELTESKSERAFLLRRIAACEAPAALAL